MTIWVVCDTAFRVIILCTYLLPYFRFKKRLKMNIFLILCLLLLVDASKQKKPHIIMIVADDLVRQWDFFLLWFYLIENWLCEEICTIFFREINFYNHEFHSIIFYIKFLKFKANLFLQIFIKLILVVVALKWVFNEHYNKEQWFGQGHTCIFCDNHWKAPTKNMLNN